MVKAEEKLEYRRHISEETRRKMSESHKGKIRSLLHSQRLSQALTGRKLSEETKRKISESKKGSPAYWKGKRMPISARLKMSKHAKLKIGKLNPFYGKKHTEKTKEKNRLSQLGKEVSLETRQKQSEAQKGEKGSNWKGGITSVSERLRGHLNWKIWRKAVFERDNHTCQNPNCPYCKNTQGVELHPHHIKPLSKFPELAFNVDNGVTYCYDYHMKSGLHKIAEGVC